MAQVTAPPTTGKQRDDDDDDDDSGISSQAKNGAIAGGVIGKVPKRATNHESNHPQALSSSSPVYYTSTSVSAKAKAKRGLSNGDEKDQIPG